MSTNELPLTSQLVQYLDCAAYEQAKPRARAERRKMRIAFQRRLRTGDARRHGTRL